MIPETIRPVLRTAIRHEGDVLLVTSGDQPGLFPDRKPKTKSAIRACQNSEKPLLEVTREEHGKGKSPNQFVRITDQGIIFLVQATPLAELPDLIAEASFNLKSRVLRRVMHSLARRRVEEENPRVLRRLVQICFETAQSLFDTFAEQRNRLVEEERILATSSRKFIDSLLARYDRDIKQVTGEIQKISDACSLLVTTPQRSESESPARPSQPSLTLVPTSDAEFDFRRNVGRELVLAWRDAEKPEVRDSIERVLMNVGIEAVGTPGEMVTYDGLSHRAEGNAKVGQSVEIIRPGWKLVNSRGSFLISHAIVRSITPEPSHAESPRIGDDNGNDAQH